MRRGGGRYPGKNHRCSLIRSVLAVLAGLFVGSLANMAIVLLNTTVLYPMPEGTSFEDQASFAAWVATLPTAAFLVVIAAHLSQAFVGGWVAARIAGRPRPPMFVGALTAAASAMNMLQLPGPAWMWIDVPLCLAVAFGAWVIEARRRQGHVKP